MCNFNTARNIDYIKKPKLNRINWNFSYILDYTYLLQEWRSENLKNFCWKYAHLHKFHKSRPLTFKALQTLPYYQKLTCWIDAAWIDANSSISRLFLQNKSQECLTNASNSYRELVLFPLIKYSKNCLKRTCSKADTWPKRTENVAPKWN